APNVRAGFLPQSQRLGVVAELDADLFEDQVGIGLDQAQAFLVEDFVFANLAGDVGKRRTGAATGAGRASGGGPPALSARAARAAFFLLFRQFSHVKSSPTHRLRL